MPRLWWCAVLSVQLIWQGCLSTPPGGEGSLDADVSDIDGGGVEDGSTNPWANLLYVSPDEVPSPSQSIALLEGEYVFDTDELTWEGVSPPDPPANAIISQSNRDLLLWSLEGLRIGSDATLRFTGSRPIMVVSWGTIDIDGVVDVSSYVGNEGDAAGATGNDCLSPGLPSGSSGGGGGAMQGAGGWGGAGGGSAGPEGQSALGLPLFPRGGCAGMFGGNADAESGQGGRPGGGVILAAATDLVIGGGVYAGGAGGQGGNTADAVYHGGGGGGSGGFIALQGASVTVPGDVMALGGGGGGGGGDSGPGVAGSPGYSPDVVRSAWSAGGSGGTGGGEDGGGGGLTSDTDYAGDDGSPGDAGGGGGGGGGGFIVIRADTIAINGTVEPAPIEL